MRRGDKDRFQPLPDELSEGLANTCREGDGVEKGA